MTAVPKSFASGVLVGGCLMAWSAPTDHDVAAAQERNRPVMMARAYTGADGKAHVEMQEIKMTLGNDGSEHSERIRVSGMSFLRRPPAHNMDFHPAPQRQLVITLSGRGEVELEDGTKYPVDSQHILLAEDTTGKGHIMRGAGTEDRLSIIVPLPDDVLVTPAR